MGRVEFMQVERFVEVGQLLQILSCKSWVRTGNQLLGQNKRRIGIIHEESVMWNKKVSINDNSFAFRCVLKGRPKIFSTIQQNDNSIEISNSSERHSWILNHRLIYRAASTMLSLSALRRARSSVMNYVIRQLVLRGERRLFNQIHWAPVRMTPSVQWEH